MAPFIKASHVYTIHFVFTSIVPHAKNVLAKNMTRRYFLIPSLIIIVFRKTALALKQYVRVNKICFDNNNKTRILVCVEPTNIKFNYQTIDSSHTHTHTHN